MLSHENRVILFAILVLTPLSLAVVLALDQPLALPSQASAAVLLLVGVLFPQLYLGYREGETDAR
jgi:hypothetical protein